MAYRDIAISYYIQPIFAPSFKFIFCKIIKIMNIKRRRRNKMSNNKCHAKMKSRKSKDKFMIAGKLRDSFVILDQRRYSMISIKFKG